MGNFNATSTVLFTDQGLDKGIIMSSGEAITAIGPNNSTYACGAGGYVGNTTSDPDLATITGGSVNDKAILEFDFIPAGSTVKFNYIFGSEEYPEFVGSTFNDVFGFFISGPGISGTQNIAIIPNTTTPIAINNVNNGYAGPPFAPASNPAYYIDNGDNGYGNTINPYKSQAQYIQYDGYTINLTATAQVQCGQTYHIKLAIADVGDQSYDSGVFIQGGSFISEASPVDIAVIEGTTAGNQATVIRGCPGTDIIFTRSSGLDTALTVNYTTSGSAIAGVDYSAIPNPVTFQIGQDSIVIPFDGLTSGSGTDSLSIKVSFSTPCGGTTTFNLVTIYIVDADNIVITAPDAAITCSNTSTQLSASATGTTPDYSWSGPGIVSGGNTATPTVNQPGTYTVTVTTGGTCPSSGTKQVEVTKTGNLAVTITSNNPEFCIGGSSDLTANPSGGTAPYTYAWDNGLAASSSNSVSPTSTTIYTVTVTDNLGCAGDATTTVTVNSLPTVLAGADQTICEGTAITLSGSGATTYIWNNGVTDGVSFKPSVGTTIYTVTGTDGNGCTNTSQVSIHVDPAPDISAGNDQTVCAGTAVVLSGSGATSYTWDNGVTDGVPFAATTTTTYTVSGDVGGTCNGIGEVVVTVNPLPTISAGENQTICAGTSVTLSGSGATSYTWDNGVANGVEFVPSATTTYKVSGTDGNGCQNSGTVTIVVEICGCTDPFALNYNSNATTSDNSCVYQEPVLEWPNIFTPNDDHVNDVYQYTKTAIVQLEYWIFNRWGNLMFEASELDKYWDGKVSGSSASDGVYFVKYKAKGINGKEFEGHTFFHLVR